MKATIIATIVILSLLLVYSTIMIWLYMYTQKKLQQTEKERNTYKQIIKEDMTKNIEK